MEGHDNNTSELTRALGPREAKRPRLRSVSDEVVSETSSTERDQHLRDFKNQLRAPVVQPPETPKPAAKTPTRPGEGRTTQRAPKDLATMRAELQPVVPVHLSDEKPAFGATQISRPAVPSRKSSPWSDGRGRRRAGGVAAGLLLVAIAAVVVAFGGAAHQRTTSNTARTAGTKATATSLVDVSLGQSEKAIAAARQYDLAEARARAHQVALERARATALQAKAKRAAAARARAKQQAAVQQAAAASTEPATTDVGESDVTSSDTTSGSAGRATSVTSGGSSSGSSSGGSSTPTIGLGTSSGCSPHCS